MGVFYAHLVLLTAGVGTAAPLSVCSLLFPCAFCVVDTGLGRLSHDATPLTPRGTRAGVLSTQCAEDLCPLREHIRVSARVKKQPHKNREPAHKSVFAPSSTTREKAHRTTEHVLRTAAVYKPAEK